MKEKFWSFGVPFMVVVAGCFVALLIHDSIKSNKAKNPGETETPSKAAK
ncbi:MAG: hypothetical protein PHT07_15235 [Paludibacter sp.]|nr:hypothetical protein [Paludibacter sp.]